MIPTTSLRLSLQILAKAPWKVFGNLFWAVAIGSALELGIWSLGFDMDLLDRLLDRRAGEWRHDRVALRVRVQVVSAQLGAQHP